MNKTTGHFPESCPMCNYMQTKEARQHIFSSKEEEKCKFSNKIGFCHTCLSTHHGSPPTQSWEDGYWEIIRNNRFPEEAIHDFIKEELSHSRQEALEELKGEIAEELKNIDISVVGFTKTLERRKGNREAFEACLSLINNKQKI